MNSQLPVAGCRIERPSLGLARTQEPPCEDYPVRLICRATGWPRSSVYLKTPPQPSMRAPPPCTRTARRPAADLWLSTTDGMETRIPGRCVQPEAVIIRLAGLSLTPAEFEHQSVRGKESMARQ